MYDFRDIKQAAFPLQNKLQIIVNGINLDKQIKGFRTLAVYGRELVSRNITTTEFRRVKVGQAMRSYVNRGASTNNKAYGNRFLGSYLSSRPLTIEYDLQAKTSREFIEAFELLNYYLDQEQAEIIFTDDRDFYWEGTVTVAETPDINNLWVKSSFELECSNPFKLAVDTEKLEFTTRGQLKKITLYPILIEKMHITLNQAGNKLIIKNLNNAQSIILDKEFVIGDTFEIDFINANINENLMKNLNITSDLEEFEILNNDEILTNLASDVVVEYREVRL